ncbi:MAG: Fe-S oxidoreductase [Rhodospirillaceae bacterium]|nr:MAG: Fe-S oxidoreductase [Rhodospirillaceae bacterium]
MNDTQTPTIGLFITCMVDLMRPSVGFAALRLLDRAGAKVVVPEKQTCCGQPAFNSGDVKNAQIIAKQVIEAFEGFDHVVAPSGSCTGMISKHYPDLFKEEPEWQARAEKLSARTFELTAYLADHLKLDKSLATFDHTVTYHDSCASRRELGVVDQPRKLLSAVDGLVLKELADTETCCGFGGLFSVKFPDVSQAITKTKTDLVIDTKADVLVGADLGCLVNQAGQLKKSGSKVRIFHIAEVLAGMATGPGIEGEGQ